MYLVLIREYLETELSGFDGTDVPTGAAANDHHVVF